MRSLLLCLLASLSVPAFQNATTWTSGYDGIHYGGGLGSMDRLFDVRPYGKDSILVVGVRADSTYCQPGVKYLFGYYRLDRVCIADNTVEMWDRSGNVLWKRFQKIEEPSYWFTSTILANGDILTAGIATVDTLNYDTSSKAMNQAVRTARISRWSRSGEILWTWRIVTDQYSAGYPAPASIEWLDALPNGDIIFLGKARYPKLILPDTDTLDIESSLTKIKSVNHPSAGILGVISSQGQFRWLKSFKLFSRSVSLHDGLSALIRGNEIIVARSVPQDTLGTTNVILSRYDASGNLLGEASPLGTTPAAVNGIAKSEDGTLLLSISPDSNAVQIAGKTVAIPADSAILRFTSTPTIGRNLLLLLDSTLTPLLAKPLSGLRRPGSWNVGRAPGHGWLAWGEDWTGYNDTANLIRLDDSLQVKETSSLLIGVRSVHAYRDELWLSGTLQGASMIGNGGTMMATRMEFDPPKPVGVSSRTTRRKPANFRIQGRSLHWLGASEGTVRISSPSGRIEWQGTLQPNGSLPLQAGMHFVQIEGHTQTIAVP